LSCAHEWPAQAAVNEGWAADSFGAGVSDAAGLPARRCSTCRPRSTDEREVRAHVEALLCE
jgi:hypothetical protein